MTVAIKVTAGNAAITTSMVGSTTISGMSFLDRLDEHSLAYGLMGTFFIGVSGLVINLWRVRQERLRDKATLAEERRHNKALEDKD